MTAQPPARFRTTLVYLVLAVLIVAADQYTKALVLLHLLGAPPLEVLPFLDLVVVFNRGAAFGFLNSAGGWQRVFFIALAMIVSAVILVMLWRNAHRNAQFALALALILAGAVGNLIDRVRWGYVVDFIDVFYHNWHWPAFNVADSAITIGAILFVMDSFGWRLFGRGAPTAD